MPSQPYQILEFSNFYFPILPLETARYFRVRAHMKNAFGEYIRICILEKGLHCIYNNIDFIYTRKSVSSRWLCFL